MRITFNNTEERGEFVRNISTGMEACSRMMYELSAENLVPALLGFFAGLLEQAGEDMVQGKEAE